MKSSIIILDFSDGEVYVFPFDTGLFSNDNIEDFFEAINELHELELQEKNCQWMIKEHLKINFL